MRRDLNLLELDLDLLLVIFRLWNRLSIITKNHFLLGYDLNLADDSDGESVTARCTVFVLLITGLNEELDGFTSQAAVKDTRTIAE